MTVYSQNLYARLEIWIFQIGFEWFKRLKHHLKVQCFHWLRMKSENWVKHYIARSSLLVLKLRGSHVMRFHLSQVAVQKLAFVQEREQEARLSEKKRNVTARWASDPKPPWWYEASWLHNIEMCLVSLKFCQISDVESKEGREGKKASSICQNKCSTGVPCLTFLPLLQQHLGTALLCAGESFHHFAAARFY